MKRGILIIILSLLLVLPFTSAISTTLKASYDKSENINAEINGNILSAINEDNIEFKRANVLVPLEYGVEQIQGRYFLWAIAPDKNDTYTLIIKNVDTTINGKQENIDYKQNFSVTENLTAYNVKPGVISIKTDFELEVNSFIDESTSVSVNFPSEQNLVLKPGKNKFTFSVASVKTNTFTALIFGRYAIPLFIDVGKESAVVNRVGLYFEPSYIRREIGALQKPIYVITLKNPENKSFDNVQFEYDKEILVLSPDGKFSMDSYASRQFNVTLKNPVENAVNEKIKIIYGSGISVDLPIEVKIGSSAVQNNVTSEENVVQYFCSELSGGKCSAEETCSGEVRNAIDGACCLGICNPSQSGSSDGNNSWIGYILALVVIGVIGYVIYKFKKSKKQAGEEIDSELGESRLKKMKETGDIGLGVKVDKNSIDAGRERKGFP